MRPVIVTQFLPHSYAHEDCVPLHSGTQWLKPSPKRRWLPWVGGAWMALFFVSEKSAPILHWLLLGGGILGAGIFALFLMAERQVQICPRCSTLVPRGAPRCRACGFQEPVCAAGA